MLTRIILILSVLFLGVSAQAEPPNKNAVLEAQKPVVHVQKSIPKRSEDTNPEGYVAILYATHLMLVADVPLEYGVYAYAAAKEQGIHPYDLAAVFIGENSWKYGDFSLIGAWRRPEDVVFDYVPHEEGQGGEVGIAQIMPGWPPKARKACQEESWAGGGCEELTVAKRTDPMTNMRLSAFVIRMAQESHSEEETVQSGEIPDGYHNWVAHYKCARDARVDMCGQCGYSKRKFRRIRHSLVSWTKPVDIWVENLRQYNKWCR